MQIGGARPGTAFKMGLKLGPIRLPLWVFTLAIMLVAAVAGQAIGPFQGPDSGQPGQPADGVAPLPGQDTPSGSPIVTPPVLRQKLSEPGLTTNVEFRNDGRECNLRVELVQLAPQGYVESTRIDRYVDSGCDGRVESVSFNGFFDRDSRSEAFFLERDREYAGWIGRLLTGSPS